MRLVLGNHHFVQLLARTDADGPPHQGISMFIVDLKTPGITMSPLWEMADKRIFTTQEINQALAKQLEATRTVQLSGLKSQHCIAVGMPAGTVIQVAGDAGDFFGALNAGGSLTLNSGTLSFPGGTNMLAIGVALLYVAVHQAAILNTVFDLYAIFSGGLVGLFALAYFTRRANWQEQTICQHDARQERPLFATHKCQFQQHGTRRDKQEISPP
jgi:hypothetical protein